MSKPVTLLVKKWGNNLAVRIPSAIAAEVKLTVDQPVELSQEDGVILIKPVGKPKLSLNQRLANFDPQKHLLPEMR